MWNKFSRECFPTAYDTEIFKYKVNKHVFIQLLHYGQDVTQGQFLSVLMLVSVQSSNFNTVEYDDNHSASISILFEHSSYTLIPKLLFITRLYIQPLLVRVDLGVMTIKRYSTLSRTEVSPSKAVYSLIQDTAFLWGTHLQRIQSAYSKLR